MFRWCVDTVVVLSRPCWQLCVMVAVQGHLEAAAGPSHKSVIVVLVPGEGRGGRRAESSQ